MEENRRSETPPSANEGVDRELTRSCSDASSLTSEDCKDIFRRSTNVTPDDHTAWTDEKHNLYLHQLEVSFVKQLHQSKCLLAQCSEQNQQDRNIFQKRLINANDASEQNGCWPKIDSTSLKPLPNCTSAYSNASLKSKWNSFEGKNKHCRPPSAERPLKLSGTVKHGKRRISYGLATSSHELSSRNGYHGDSFELNREGTGQNFLDEDNQITLKVESQAKRLKTALTDSSSQDQAVHLKKCPSSDY